MSRSFTRREAITMGLGAAAGSTLLPAFPVSAESLPEVGPINYIVPSPKRVEMGSEQGISPHRLEGCLIDWDNFQPDKWIRVSKGAVDASSEESYRLEIDHMGASVRGASDAGIFYGVQTLIQIVRGALAAGVDIPAVTIIDWPDIAYRAVHFDSKHHLDTLDAYYGAIDRLASLKINAIIWEFEDKLRYRRRPIVGAANAISIEEMQALTRYAGRRHVSVSPLVQGLGHASFVLKHQEFAHLRDDPESDWAFDPLADETYELQFDLYRDAMEATPGSRYLHIGGDEVNVGESQRAKAAGMGPLELHLYWLNRVTGFLVENGRTPIMWDDMPLKHGGVYQTTHDESIGQAESDTMWNESEATLSTIVSQFPREAVYMRWSYHTPEIAGNQKALDWYARSGLQVMTSTAAQTRWPVYPRRNGNTGPIRQLCRMTAERSLSGILCTSWDDDSPHMAFFWRGWTCFSDLAWHSTARNEAESLLAFANQAFGPDAASLAVEGLTALERAMDIWDTALITANRRNVCRADTMEGIIEPPGSGGLTAWRLTHRDRIQEATEGVKLSEQARTALESAIDLSQRNRYELRLALALVNLQAWSHEVLSRGSAPELSLNERWEIFLDLYQQQRILHNPAGYILDQNHHTHQANSSNGPDWMIAVELEYDRRLQDS